MGACSPPVRSDTVMIMARIAAPGLNSVRLMTGFAANMPQDGVIDTDYLNDFRRRVERVAGNGAEHHGLKARHNSRPFPIDSGSLSDES